MCVRMRVCVCVCMCICVCVCASCGHWSAPSSGGSSNYEALAAIVPVGMYKEVDRSGGIQRGNRRGSLQGFDGDGDSDVDAQC